MIVEAELVLAKPPPERKLTGRRLVSVSRDALHRVGTLALVYRTTGDRKYLDAGRATLLTIAGVKDYDPSPAPAG